jgi:hypothetical protein
MFHEHHLGVPSKLPFEAKGITEFDFALMTEQIKESDPGPCIGCGDAAELHAHWLPRYPVKIDDGTLPFMIYGICQRCWNRMQRNENRVRKIEARLVENRPTEWHDAPIAIQKLLGFEP